MPSLNGFSRNGESHNAGAVSVKGLFLPSWTEPELGMPHPKVR